MNFEDESYVKVYKRLTLGMKLSGWDGRAVLRALFMHVDRAGVVDIDGENPAEALAALEDMPIEIARTGMAKLLERGTVMVVGKVLFIPNFLRGQEAKQSDAQRQRESRAARVAKKRAEALGLPVTNCDEPPNTPDVVAPRAPEIASRVGVSGPQRPDGHVTNRDDSRVSPSQNVTGCSENPSAGHSEQCSADQRIEADPPPDPRPDPLVPKLVVVGADIPIPCPADLSLTAAQRATMLTGGMPEYAIDELTQRFRTRSQAADPSENRSLARWRRSLDTFIHRQMSDSRTRPRAPGAQETDEQTRARLKSSGRQPNAHDHTTDEGHLNAIGATEV